MKFLFVVNLVFGLGNLADYAYGSQEPARLAVGIACLFVATMLNSDLNGGR